MNLERILEKFSFYAVFLYACHQLIYRRYISSRITQKGEQDERTAHLSPGIWAASGTGGADVRPVLMFVRPGRGYQPRFDMDKVAKRADAEVYLERRIRYRLREAAGV